MNKETKKIFNYINDNPKASKRLMEIKARYKNSRNFYNQLGYLIMEIVNTNREFININRSKIEIELLSERYFG